MKRRMMLILMLLILITSNTILIILYSRTVIDRRQLQDKLEGYSKIKFRPLPVFLNNGVKLGEKVALDVFIVLENKDNIPLILYKDSVNRKFFDIKELKDTLHLDSYYKTFRYEFKPKYRGEYTWRGVVFNEFMGRIDSLYFEADYYVEQNDYRKGVNLIMGKLKVYKDGEDITNKYMISSIDSIPYIFFKQFYVSEE